MNKLLIMISLIGLFSCNSKIKEPSFYEVITPAPPIENNNSTYDIPAWSHFDLDYDTLDFLIENPPLKLKDLYEKPWSNKIIAEKFKNEKSNENECKTCKPKKN